jgi:GNAT superfamily N-acetyltransferase
MELRLVTKQDMEQAVKLSDFIFRDQEHSSMGDAFPFIFDPGISHSYGAFDGERLVSFMGLVPAVIRVGAARLHVFQLGSVCTHPDYRGQGIAKSLLKLCKQHAEAAGASLLFISGDIPLYTRAHCYPFGQAHSFTIDAAAAERFKLEGLLIRSMELTDLPAIQQMASLRAVAFEQSVTDLQQLIHAGAFASIFKFKHRVLVSVNSSGEPEAFVVIGAPDIYEVKRNPIALEWGGPADQVAALLAEAIGTMELSQLDLNVGWQEEKLIELFQEAGLSMTIKSNSGTVYIVNSKQLLKQAEPFFNQAGDAAQWVRALTLNEDGTYVLDMPQREIPLTPEELVAFLFNPTAPQSAAFPNYSPIPLPYLSGLNYI